MEHLVTLLPTNARHKQLIKQHGSTWRVLGTQHLMPCFGGAAGFQIESLDGCHTRNVLLTDVRE